MLELISRGQISKSIPWFAFWSEASRLVGSRRPHYKNWRGSGARIIRLTDATNPSYIPTNLGLARGRREAPPRRSEMICTSRIDSKIKWRIFDVYI